MARSYHEEQNLEYAQRIREICEDMPLWFIDFIRSQADVLTPLTRFNYCIDARIFFTYLIQEHRDFYGYAMHQITPAMLGALTHKDLEVYVEYLGYYIKVDAPDDEQVETDGASQELEYENGERGKARKIASLRSMYKYLYKNELVQANPAELLSTPKIHEKTIIRLTPEEISRLLHTIEEGEGLSERQKAYQKKTIKRDLTMIVLFLTTGIRVSELAGLDISDIDFETNSFRIVRKGGNESILYFGQETAEALQSYLEERQALGTYERQSPLFLSMQNKRINVRSIENLVKKYALAAVPLKKITPHKLRSTYGTMLYQNTGDIYLVADVLGHKDVNTTRKHYAAMSEENRKMAARAIQLREEK